MNKKTFLNVKDQIGSCGIWCGSCIAGNGVLQELTRRFGDLIKKYGLEQWAPKDFDFKEFTKGLTSIQNMDTCPGCLKGGGRPDCEIRACTVEKNIPDCSLCTEIKSCPNSELLDQMRQGSLEAGLNVKTEDVDKRGLLEVWMAELKNRFPSNLLFTED